MSAAEREQISQGLAAGLKQTAIAAELGRSAGTVSREIRRNSASQRSYRAKLAHGLARRRQCATTFMYDPTALRLMDILGADNVLWSIDYPHTESVYGFAGEIAKDIWDKLGPTDDAKVLGGNAACIWGIAPLH